MRKLHNYQIAARDFVLDRLERSSGAGLWLDPGLGKTIVALKVFQMMQMLYGFKTCTVVAPAQVLVTSWPGEIADWQLPLTWQWIQGSEDEREAAIAAKPDIYFLSAESLAKATVDNVYVGEGFTVGHNKDRYYLSIGSEERIFSNLGQLVQEYPQCESVKSKRFRRREQLPDFLKRIKFSSDLLIVDESTKFKSWMAGRTGTLKNILPRMQKRITLTGTPVPNNLGEDIFPQQYILDSGETLGTTIGGFRDRWERSCGFQDRDYEVVPALQATLIDLIAPWYLRQDINDHLDMPGLVQNEILVKLPSSAMKIYKGIEKEMFAELDSGDMLLAMSGGSKYNLCRQIASGSAYDAKHNAIGIHDAKLEALSNLYEELNGKQLLVAYCFTHELQKIQKRFPKIDFIGNGSKPSETANIITKWKNKEIGIVAAQCQAMSHGVNGFQSANDICFFSPTDQPEVDEQFYKRIYRQGVTGQVRVHRLIAQGTVDLKISRTVRVKGATQKDVLDAVKFRGELN